MEKNTSIATFERMESNKDNDEKLYHSGMRISASLKHGLREQSLKTNTIPGRVHCQCCPCQLWYHKKKKKKKSSSHRIFHKGCYEGLTSKCATHTW